MRDSAAVMPWGRPVTEPGAGWAVIDVETSGFKPGSARVISSGVAAASTGCWDSGTQAVT